MKIRTDYVTNSSSSSFILSFKDEASIEETLRAQFPKDIPHGWSEHSYGYGYDDEDDERECGYLTQLLEEIKNADRLTKEELIKEIQEQQHDISDVWFHIMDFLTWKKGMSWSQAADFLETKEGKLMIQPEYDKRVNEVLGKIGDNKIIVEVEHGDGGEGEDGVLEHDILPYLDCTAVRFSHH